MPESVLKSAGESAPVMGVAASHASRTVESAIALLEKELVELKDRHLRLQAEMENFRKRKNRESADLRKFAAEPVIRALLPAIDHLDLALDSGHDRTVKEWGDGIALIAKQLADALKSHEVEEILPAVGAPFDAGVHEAVSWQESSQIPPDHIVTVTRRGYRLHDRLLRAAQVVVAKTPSNIVEAAARP